MIEGKQCGCKRTTSRPLADVAVGRLVGLKALPCRASEEKECVRELSVL